MGHGRGYACAGSPKLVTTAAQPEQLRQGPPRAASLRGRTAPGRGGDYGLIAAAEFVRSAFSELPTELTAAMMVIEIPTTISPYSIAVAPDSQDKKFTISLLMTNSGLKIHPTITDFFFVLNNASWEGAR
jgi:hypothetical protein